MDAKKTRKRENILLTALIVIFSVYLGSLLFFNFAIDPFVLFQAIARKSILLFSLVTLLAIISFLVIYNIYQIVHDRLQAREGSKFRFRLTVFFLIVTLIPAIPLSLISNNLITRSINLWFVRGIEESLVDGLEMSKELYNRLSGESMAEWKKVCGGCTEDQLRSADFKIINGIFRYDPDNHEITAVLGQDTGLARELARNIETAEINPDEWRRITASQHEYLITSVATAGGERYLISRKVPATIARHAASISSGLQNYRSIKIVIKPLIGVITLVLIVIVMPFFMLSIYLSLVISKEVTVPIRELAIATQKIADDKLDYRVEFEAKDELKLLIDSFNEMTEELRVNRQLVKHSERIAAWQDIARKIAHEIKNPLTPIKLSAQRLLKLYSEGQRFYDVLVKGINTIITEVDNINEMLNEFSQFTRFPETKVGTHDIVPIIDDVITLLRDSYRNMVFTFIHPEKSIYLRIDGMQIRRALLNILYNSIAAVKEHGTVTVECCSGDGDASSGVRRYIIAVTDNGPGIDPDIRDAIFDPYVSKNTTGSGLGLTIVEKIVFDNRGRIWFDSEPGKTTFYMEFEKA